MEHKKIKLMPDYYCSPLWWVNNNQVGNIDPVTLPIQQETLARLAIWANAFDAQLNIDDPASSSFLSGEALDSFDTEGMLLWLQLRKELQGQYDVAYYSIKLERLLDSPES